MQTLENQDITNAQLAETPPAEPPTGRGPKPILPGVNDLATTHPEVAALWDWAGNGGLTPQQLLAGSNKKVWWCCERGHSWQAAAYALTINGTRCPYCTGKKVLPGETDLMTRYPDIAALWDSERNAVPPTEVMPASKKKYWWRCREGHRWQAAAYSLTLVRSGCPYCSGRRKISGKTDLATLYPEVAKQWAAERNEADPSVVAPTSRKFVWWRCEKGHDWCAQVYSVAAGKSHCPTCAEAARRRRQSREAPLLAQAKTSL